MASIEQPTLATDFINTPATPAVKNVFKISELNFIYRAENNAEVEGLKNFSYLKANIWVERFRDFRSNNSIILIWQQLRINMKKRKDIGEK